MILSIKTDQLDKYMEHADYKIYREGEPLI